MLSNLFSSAPTLQEPHPDAQFEFELNCFLIVLYKKYEAQIKRIDASMY